MRVEVWHIGRRLAVIVGMLVENPQLQLVMSGPR